MNSNEGASRNYLNNLLPQKLSYNAFSSYKSKQKRGNAPELLVSNIYDKSTDKILSKTLAENNNPIQSMT